MLKVVVVGTGVMGCLHLNTWSHQSGVKIVGIIGRNNEKRDELAETYACGSLETLQELLNVDVDVIDICLPTYLHEESIKEASKYCKHIICEKPLALNVDSCRSIIDVCKEQKIQLFVGQVLRFFPEYVDAWRKVKEGAIGEPGVVRLSRGAPFPRGKDAWYGDQSKSGGVILDLGIHDFDWLRWTFGEVERVMARKKVIIRENHPIEYALVMLRMTNGTIAHVELSWSKLEFEASFELAGKKGMISYNSNESKPIQMQLLEEEKELLPLIVPTSILERSPLDRQLAHFKECIEKGEEPIVSYNDALKSVEIAEAAITSVRLGKPVFLKQSEVLK
ncbi:Gfo/Idh/MocA family protein [Halalkalibacter kiskunsagensis]|uniref:Gfo/Idh/MocA family protein n=1 Tax=Halalkalibacter kiskunsagensis TaxID=1548599 RepID=A0ABV6KEC5_9BACI